MITLHDARQVVVKLPRVFRYMDAKFISAFFDAGQLRLGSFARFRSYPDEIRGDTREGSGTILGKGESGFQFMLQTGAGVKGYMLCTSLVESADLKTQFGVDSYFSIDDPLSFAVAVANSIPGCTEVRIGCCDYVDHRILNKNVPGLSPADFADENGNIVIGGPGMMKRITEMAGDGSALVFLKERKYQTQAEFRMMWVVDTEHFEVAEYIDVVAKRAVKVCSRGEDFFKSIT